MKKKFLMLIGIVLTVCMLTAVLTACNGGYKACYDKTYSAHVGTNYEGDCTDIAKHSHGTIAVKKGLGKAYVKISTNSGTKKAKLVSTTEETMTFRGESITVVRMTFTAEWLTVDLMGGKETKTETVTYTYYPDGDYFIDGSCIMRCN